MQEVFDREEKEGHGNEDSRHDAYGFHQSGGQRKRATGEGEVSESDCPDDPVIRVGCDVRDVDHQHEANKHNSQEHRRYAGVDHPQRDADGRGDEREAASANAPPAKARSLRATAQMIRLFGLAATFGMWIISTKQINIIPRSIADMRAWIIRSAMLLGIMFI